jgi:hypothetical protein
MKDFWNQTLGWTKDWKNRECLDTRLGYLFSIGGPAATGLLTLFPMKNSSMVTVILHATCSKALVKIKLNTASEELRLHCYNVLSWSNPGMVKKIWYIRDNYITHGKYNELQKWCLSFSLMYKDLSLSEMMLYTQTKCSDFLAGKMSRDHLLFTGVIVVVISAVYICEREDVVPAKLNVWLLS